DAVISLGTISDVPEAVLSDFEDRLARSELGYRRQAAAGIPEQNIVVAVNNLAQKLSAPDFARTDASEVALLRRDSASYMPHFISSDRQAMSPLESAYILRVLLYQKVWNETFLMSAEERAALTRNKLRLSAETQGQSKKQTVTMHPRVK